MQPSKATNKPRITQAQGQALKTAGFELMQDLGLSKDLQTNLMKSSSPIQNNTSKNFEGSSQAALGQKVVIDLEGVKRQESMICRWAFLAGLGIIATVLVLKMVG